MSAPARHRAFTVLVFVGASSLALVIAALSIRLVAGLMGIHPTDAVEWIISVIAAFTGGGIGANEYRKRAKTDG